jgi:antitoxin YefM
MDVLTIAELRSKLKAVMDRVVSDHAPVVVTRPKAEAVVMVSLADWRAMEDTARLLSPPKNAERLLEAIAQLEGRDGVQPPSVK